MNKKTIVISCAFILLLLLLYCRIIRLPFGPVHPHQAIPSHTALFFSIDNDELESLTNSPPALADLFLPKNFTQSVQLLKEISGSDLNSKNKNPFYVSINPSKKFGTDLLFIIPNIEEKNLQKLIVSLDWQSRIYQFKGQSIFTLKKENQTAAIARFRNLFLLAEHAYLVENAISQLKSPNTSICEEKKFRHIFKNTKTTENEFPIFINIKNLSAQFAPLLNTTKFKEAKNIDKQGEWLQLSMPLNKQINKWKGQFIPPVNHPIFQNSKPSQAKLNEKIWASIPNNLSGFVTLKNNDLTNIFSDHFIKEELTDEITIAIGEPMKNGEAEQFILINLKNTAQAEQILKETAGEPFKNYQLFDIWKLSKASKIPLFNTAPYFITILEDYILFSNNLPGTERWLGKYLAGQTCAKDVSFLQLKSKLPAQSNFIIYMDGIKGWQLIAPFFNTQSNISLNRNPLPFQKTLGSLQWTKEIGQLTFVNEGAKKTDNPAANILWSAPLLANAISQPYVNINPENGEKDIFIYDQNNRIYLINSSGQLLWRRQLNERISSDVFHLELNNNGEGQFAFSTRSAIYIVDRKGEDVDGFPLELQTPASNGVTVVDFFQSNEYNFFIACKNGKAYGFDEKGSPIEGWRPNESAGHTKYPILHFQTDGKDFLALLNINGKIKVYKKNGRYRFNSVQIESSDLQELDFQISKKSSRIVTANNEGKVFVTNLSGQGFALQLNAGNNINTQFLFTDILGDERKDYITISENNLTTSYYDENNKFKQAFQHTYPWPQDDIFSVKWERRKKNFIGSLNKNKKQLFLLDGNGKIPNQFPLAGSTPFVIEDLSGEGKPVVVTGNGAEVTAYSLE